MHYLGIDLGGTNIAAGIVNQNHQILGRGKIKTTVPCSEDEMIAQLANAAMAALKDANKSMGQITWAGIGCPGAVNTEKGIVEFSSNLFFHNFQLKTKLEEKLGKKVFMENDANAAAYGEFRAGALQGARNALAITLGTGVGCGIIVDGSVYSGSNFAAGEMGHMVIQMGGRPCHCGRKGCWEQYAAATGLKQTTREMMAASSDHTSPIWKSVEGDLSKVKGRTAFDAMRAGDPLGKAIVNQYIEHLGCGVANAINIFEPDLLCIGGGVANEGNALLEPLQDYVDREQYPITGKRTTVCLAKLGNDAGIIGAALLGELE
ncbi:MAG: ROK family protein [Clostridiales bacterium]|nr:ROK family protein [Clostridiales bacterium]